MSIYSSAVGKLSSPSKEQPWISVYKPSVSMRQLDIKDVVIVVLKPLTSTLISYFFVISHVVKWWTTGATGDPP